MSIINWTDQVTPLNAVNMNALEQVVRKNAASGYVGLDASSNIAFAAAQQIVWNADTSMRRSAAGWVAVQDNINMPANVDHGISFLDTTYNFGGIRRRAAVGAMEILSQNHVDLAPAAGNKIYITDHTAGTLGTLDTNLYRYAANVLRTDSQFRSVVGFYVDVLSANVAFHAVQSAAGYLLRNELAVGDTQWAFSIMGDGKLNWGPGGTTPTDTNLYRQTTDTLRTDDSFYATKDVVANYQNAANQIWLSPTTGISFGAPSDVTLRRSAAGQLALAAVSYYAPVSDALLGAVKAGNGIEWGHSNPAGYRSVLGADNGGNNFIALHGEAGTNVGTYRTRGVLASIIRANVAGGFAFGTVASANADNQTFVQTMALNAAGNLLVTGTLAANGAISGASLATSAYGTTFPASPVDGQEFTLVNGLTGMAWAWRFRYNASSSSAYKWEFIGGAGYVANTFTGGETLATANTWTYPPTLTDFVVPRAGDYMVEFGATFYAGPGGASTMQAAVANASVSTTPVTSPGIVYIPAASQPATVSAKYGVTVTVAGQTLRLAYQQTIVNGQITQRYIGITPLRLA